MTDGSGNDLVGSQSIEFSPGVNYTVTAIGGGGTPLRLAPGGRRARRRRVTGGRALHRRRWHRAPAAKEIADVDAAVHPSETLLVVDAMTGQEAVGVAQAFGEAVPVTGLILTKIDGDARGGAALSISAVTGVPVKFMGTGEKTDALEVFHPDRLAGRILGMGDVLTLVERAQETFDAKQAEQMAEKLRKASFTLEDFLEQMQQLKKMGPLGQLVAMIPGLGGLPRRPRARSTAAS